MEFGYAFLGGTIAKAYDDLYDNKIVTNETAKEVLKGFHWCFLTLLSHNDFNFTLAFYIANALNACANWESGYNFPYETSLLTVYPFFLLINYSTRAYFNPYDWMYAIFYMLGMFIEPFIVTEEYSYSKLFSRMLLSFYFVLGILVIPYLDVSPSIAKILYYSLGYSLFSSGFQMYALYLGLAL